MRSRFLGLLAVLGSIAAVAGNIRFW